jgi:hypothetical protein|tara:strand:+ start:152 stop:325 length:174 start_codon:yes stop_codon:yes gene_type:complete
MHKENTKAKTTGDNGNDFIADVIVPFVCDRVNSFDNNRCINCGAKAGHKCEKQTNAL